MKVTELPVNHRAREHGKSKYNLSKTVRVILDLITVKFLLSYSTRPIQIFGLVGLVGIASSIAMMLGVGYSKIAYDATVSNNSFFLLAVIFFLLGGQFIAMGLLGEIIVRTYHEAQNKPRYVIARTQNLRAGYCPGQPKLW